MSSKKKQKAATVGFIALGCPKNIVDSERMLAEIAKAGFLITTSPDNADVVVINTCGFIAPAKDEALEAIKNTAECKTRGTVRKIIVAGCLSERLGAELFNQAKGVDAIVGLGRRDLIAQIIEKTLCSDEKTAYLDRPSQTLSSDVPKYKKGHLFVPDDRTRLLITPSHWAYLRISEGCNHRCSFCTIPAIRGPLRSKLQNDILTEASELARSGVVELNVIAQDTTCYGRDLKIKNGLAALSEKLEKIDGLKWIRLMYLCPSGIDDTLIETIVKSERIVHYIDMPIQHINDEILKAMRRLDTKDRICRLIQKLREALPDVVLRTTIIAGLPGETEQQFGELLEFIEWAKFDALGCFKFYAEPGTEAAGMPAQVPQEIKRRRVEKLMLTQQKIAFAKNKKRIGTELLCLVDSVNGKDVVRGHFYGQAPGIDSLCIIQNCRVKPGRFINTKVVATKNYDLVVRQI